MARARLLKPGFFVNDELAKLKPLTRLLFQGLWCIADREGRLEDRPPKIKAQVLPYDGGNVKKMLDELQAAGFVVRYEQDGGQFIQVVNFKRHQTPHQKEPASTIPAPPSSEVSTGLEQDSSKSSRALTLNPIPLTGSSSGEDATGATAASDDFLGCVRAFDDLHGSAVCAIPVQNAITGWIASGTWSFPGQAAEWFVAACDEAALSFSPQRPGQKPPIRYVLSILERWQREGFKADTREQRNGRATDLGPQASGNLPAFDFEAAERARDEREARVAARAAGFVDNVQAAADAGRSEGAPPEQPDEDVVPRPGVRQ